MSQLPLSKLVAQRTESTLGSQIDLQQTPWDLLAHLEALLTELAPHGTPSLRAEGVLSSQSDRIFLGHDVCIEKGAYIEGPCYLGQGTVIRHGARVGAYSVIGSECVIGHGVEVKRSIVLDHSQLGHFNYVGDSILGYGVHLGAGAKLCNLRFDSRDVQLVFASQTYDTQRRKLGAILGDGGKVGANAVCLPGTVLPPLGIVFPGQVVGGDLTQRSARSRNP